MYRYLFRFFVMTLTILTANLLTSALSDYMVSYKNQYKPFTFTLLGMGVIVLIFYPLFVKLEGWVRDISVKAIKSGKSLGGKYLGLILTFLICMAVLMYFYAKMWFHINIFETLFHL